MDIRICRGGNLLTSIGKADTVPQINETDCKIKKVPNTSDQNMKCTESKFMEELGSVCYIFGIVESYTIDKIKNLQDFCY